MVTAAASRLPTRHHGRSLLSLTQGAGLAIVSVGGVGSARTLAVTDSISATSLFTVDTRLSWGLPQEVDTVGVSPVTPPSAKNVIIAMMTAAPGVSQTMTSIDPDGHPAIVLSTVNAESVKTSAVLDVRLARVSVQTLYQSNEFLASLRPSDQILLQLKWSPSTSVGKPRHYI